MRCWSMDYNIYLGVLIYTFSFFVRASNKQCSTPISINPEQTFEGEGEVNIRCAPNKLCNQPLFWMKYFDSKWNNVFKYENDDFEPITDSGYSLSGRSRGFAITDTNILVIIEETQVIDSGNWMCQSSSQEQNDANELLVLTRTTNDDIMIHRESPTIIGYEQRFTCTSDRVFPRYEVEWQIDGRQPQEGDIIADIENSDKSWSINNTMIETLMNADESKISCSLKYPELDDIIKDSDDTNIRYAVTLEYLKSTENGTVLVNDVFKMTCVASGSDPQISWEFNGNRLDKGFNETNDSIKGSFAYRQTVAELSNQTWTMSEQEKNCENLNSYNGNYQCFAVVEVGDIKTEASSDMVFVSVTHKPLMKTTNWTVIIAAVDENVTLTCELDCSNPPVTLIKWSSTKNRDELEEFDDKTVAFVIIKEEDYDDTIHCTVTNDVGDAMIKYNFHREPTVPQTTTTPEVSTTSEPLTTTIITGDGGDTRRRDLIIANVVIYTLVAIFSVITALLYRHYRRLAAIHEGDGQELIEHKGKSDKANENLGFDNAGAIYEEVPQQHQSTEGANTQRSDKKKSQSPASPTSTPNLRKRGDIGQTNVRPTEHTVMPKHNPGQNKAENIAQHHTAALDTETNGAKANSSSKLARENPKPRGPKPPISRKPSDRASRMNSSVELGYSDVQLRSGKYDNHVSGQPESRLYANCGVSETPKHDDGKVTYAELNLQHEDPYSEGAPDVPLKRFNDNETVQYASIKHST